MIVCNHRLRNESRQDFVDRRRIANRAIKIYLQRGVPATPRPSLKGTPPVRFEYVPGPHKTHKPHEVTQVVDTPWVDAYGKLHDTRTFRVLHPGTLVKVQA